MPVTRPLDGSNDKAAAPTNTSDNTTSGMHLGTDFKRWLIASVIVTMPLLVLQRTAEDWQYPYIMLILLSLIVFYADEIAVFVEEVRSL